MPWQADQKGVTQSWRTDGGVEFAFRADSFRNTATGLHARLSILQDNTVVEYDMFNTGRRDDRGKLANAAWDKLAKDDRPDKKAFAFMLGQFCLEFWERWNAAYGVEELVGDAESGPPPFLLTPYLLEGAGTLLFGDPGLGKSNTALLMAQSINCGVSQFWTVRREKVLYVNLERSRQSIRRRMVFVNLQLGLRPEEPLAVLNARGRTLADVIEQVDRAIETLGVKVIVVDSLSRAGAGSLTEDQNANRIMDNLNGAAETWLAIAHSPRGDKTHAYGSMMLDAAADVIVQVLGQRKADGTLGLGFQVTKANDIAFPDMAFWAMEFDEHGLSLFRKARSGEFADIEAGKRMSLTDQVAEYLLQYGKADAENIAEAIGHSRERVSKALNKDERFTFVERDGKRKLYAVKAQL